VLEGLGWVAAVTILGAVGNFKYEVWAQPVGYVKRMVSNYAQDTDLQKQIGEVIVEQIEGFLCDTSDRCLDVANFEMMVTTAQRNRVVFDKVAHLQDEEGDTITFPHLYTDKTMQMFITNLKRIYQAGTGKSKSSRYVVDQMEGWVIQ
jgi:hypothetical protein